MKSGLVIDPIDGTKRWYRNGRCHREDGPAIEYADGKSFSWFVNGRLHCTDGPAFVGIESTEYWVLNKLHRFDGPAVIHQNGDVEYYINNSHIKVSSLDEFLEYSRNWQVKQVLET